MPVLTVRQFMERQDEVLERSFRSRQALVREAGLVSDPVVTEQRGGFHVVFRHELSMAEQVATVAKRIATVVSGTVAYGKREVHTTIGDAGVTPGFQFDDRNSEQTKVLDRLTVSVNTALASRGQRDLNCAITYNGCLSNQTTVIAPGRPNSEFLRVIRRIRRQCQKLDLPVSIPWGAHITVARFGQAMPPDQLTPFFQLMDGVEYVVGTSRLTCVDVGHFTCGPKGFRITVMARFPLR